MDADLAGIAERLEAIAEELADLALERLHASVRAGETRAPLDERRVTPARRAIDTAVHLLRTGAAAASDD